MFHENHQRFSAHRNLSQTSEYFPRLIIFYKFQLANNIAGDVRKGPHPEYLIVLCSGSSSFPTLQVMSGHPGISSSRTPGQAWPEFSWTPTWLHSLLQHWCLPCLLAALRVDLSAELHCKAPVPWSYTIARIGELVILFKIKQSETFWNLWAVWSRKIK